MKRFLFSILFFVGVVQQTYGATYRAISNGEWTDALVWDVAPFDGNGGDGIPGASDIAITNNFQIAINPAFGDITVARLTVSPNTANSIYYSDPFFTFTPVSLNINTSLSSAGPPSTTIIENSSFLLINISGTGSTVLNSWNANATFQNLTISSSGSLAISSNIAMNGGNLSVASGASLTLSSILSDPNTNSTITVDTGANLIVNGSINGDGSNSSKFNNVDIQGNVTTGTSGYINADNFTLGSSSTFTINFNGVNQTEGWWYQTAGPAGTFTLDPSSTVIYNASANQVVGAQEYGDLRLRSQSGASVKSLQSSGNLLVQGLLRLNSGNVTFDTSPNTNPISIEGNVQNLGNWSPTQLVIFSGASPQSINGANQITFAGGLRVSNTAGLTLNNIGIDINGELDVDPSCSFNPSDQVVTVLGDMRIDGTLIAGTNPGGFVFDGTTEFLGSGTRGFYDWTIDATASVLAPLEGNLTIHRNWTNNGSFAHNNGLVTFSDAPTKSISGSANTSFYNLAAEGGTVNVNGTVDLENVMTFAGNPTVDLDGSGSGVFTLKSTPIRDAAIGNIGGATVNGNITSERYIDRVDATLDRGFHIVGFPSAGVTIADVQVELPINGPFTGTSGYVGDGSINPNNPSLYRYVENVGGGIRDRYRAYSTTNDLATFTNGEGYHLFTFTGLSPITIDGRGAIKTGPFTRNLSYTTTGGTATDAGWHTIANPYPAASDWFSWTKTNINANTAHLFDPQTGNYIVLDGSIAGQLIPQGQGVFVKTTAAGSVAATESSKVTGTTPIFYRSSGAPLARFEIILRKDTIDDIAIVSFNDNATDNYEAALDANRLLNEKETFSTLTADGEAVKVNRLASISQSVECSRSIFFKLEQMVEERNYQFLFRDLDKVAAQSFVLIDHYLNETVQVDGATVINFQVNSDLASKDDGRFELVFSVREPNEVSSFATDVCVNENAIITIENTELLAEYILFKNDSVISTKSGSGSSLDFDVSSALLLSGTNDFIIKAFLSACDTSVVGNAQVRVEESLNLSNEVTGSSVCTAQSGATFVVSTQMSATYYILNGQDTIQSFTGTGNDYQGVISSINLVNGLNEFDINAKLGECQSARLEQALEINVGSSPNAVINELEDLLTCANSSVTIDLPENLEISNYLLYVGEDLIKEQTGTSFTVSPSETTTYKLTGVSVGGCELNTVTFTVEVVNLAEPGILISANILESSVEAANYQWYLDNEPLQGETAKVLVASQSGEYKVEVSEGNCSAISDAFMFNQEVLNANKALENALKLFPNPVEDKMFIQMDGLESIEITIYTTTGTFIDRFMVDGNKSEIDMSKFTKGMYLIKMESDKGSVTKRLIKQ